MPASEWLRSFDTISGAGARYRDGVPEDFVVACNAEPGSTRPYLLRVPLGDGIILKAKDT